MKNALKIIVTFSLFLSVGWLFGQTSAITATITDTPDGQTWNNGTCSLAIYSPNGVPSVAGTPLTAAQKAPSCSISGSGVLTATVVDTSTISPTGAQWTFTISPNAISGTYTARMGVTGATPNLSSALSALANSPRFPVSPSSYGYLDAEVSPTPLPGGTYYNVTTPAWRQWSGSAWSSVGGSAGAPATCVVGTYGCTGLANTWTAANTFEGTNIGDFKIIYAPDPADFAMDFSYNTIQTPNSQLNINAANSVIELQNAEVPSLTTYGSHGVYIGSTPADPGTSNLAVQGGVTISGGTNIVYRCTGGTFAGLLAYSDTACTGGTATATSLTIN